MVRNYKTKSTENKWSDEQLAAALLELRIGKGAISVNAAAKKYGIPWSTLHDHYEGISTKRYGGKSTVLSREEESEVLLTCISLQELGFGLTRATVGRVIKDYLLSNGRLNPFRQGIPGYDWWQGFLQRWPIVSERNLNTCPYTEHKLPPNPNYSSGLNSWQKS